MAKSLSTIDDLLKRLEKTLDGHLTDRGTMNAGDQVEVGYFELRDLLEYVDAQHNNLVVLERIVNTITDTTERFSQGPFVEWRRELQVTRKSPGFVVR